MANRSVILRAFFLAMMFCGGLHAIAQEPEIPSPFRKGRFFFSTAFSWKTENYDLKDINRWNLEPQVGYFVIKNLAVGLGGVIGVHAFDYFKDNTAQGTTTTNIQNTSWGALGPFTRYHMGGPRLSPYVQVGVYFGSLHQESENNMANSSVTVKGVQEGAFQFVDLGAGLAWYYKQLVGVEVAAHYYLAYAQTSSDYTYSTGETSHTGRVSNSADGGGGSIGLVFLFGLSKGQQAPAPAN